ncbi:MAG: hypothetical protein ACRDQF_18635 [Thermocrispum sp.]
MRAMLGDRPVDELHLFRYPVTRGCGPKLFADGAPTVKMALGKAESFDNGVVYLNYRAEP